MRLPSSRSPSQGVQWRHMTSDKARSLPYTGKEKVMLSPTCLALHSCCVPMPPRRMMGHAQMSAYSRAPAPHVPLSREKDHAAHKRTLQKLRNV